MLTMGEIFKEIQEKGGVTPSRKVRQIAEKFPGHIAMRDKRFGKWEEITYKTFWEQVQWVGCALNYFGVQKQDTSAVHSENRPEWLIADIGIQSIGGITVGLYPTNPPAEVQYLLSHSESKVLFAEDQEQVDKAIDVISEIPDLVKIVYFEPRGLSNYDNEKLMSWDEFLEIGKEEYEKNSEFVISRMDDITSEDIAMMIYTSGTTGPPKGSMLTHGNIEWTASQIPELSFTPTGVTNPQYLSYLPLCHVFGRLVDTLIGITTMGTINFAESIDTVQKDLAEIQPSIFPAVPRILERMHAGTLVRMKDASRLKKILFSIASYFGNITAQRWLQHGDKDKLAMITNFIAQLIAFRALRKKLGLKNIDSAISGAAPIAPEILRFFMSMGVPIYEGYGMTENSAIATGNRPEKVKLGTVGTPQPNVELKLAEDGEILVRHGGVFKGYFKNDEATKEVLDKDGWLYTGDIGVFEDNYLKITDRKKDILVTPGGDNISPIKIENELVNSELIDQAIVYGDNKPYLVALLILNNEINIIKDVEIKNEIEKINKNLTKIEKIKKFFVIKEKFSIENGMLTPTLKLKRYKIIQKYKTEFERNY